MCCRWRARSQSLDRSPQRPSTSDTDLGVTFIDVAKEAGLNAKTIFGGEHKNKYLLETTGCGVAFYDYDNDGWLDIFLVNGWRLEGFPPGEEPFNHLFKNNRDGTFTDVTLKAGLKHTGWGQGVCIGDYDNDGNDDLFITYFGKNVLYHNNGNGTFTDVSEKSGVAGMRTRWATGCAFLDYDRDGKLDLFVANYIDLDLKTAPVPESGPCLYKAVMVACGPPGLNGDSNILYHNNGDGTFTDVSDSSGIKKVSGTYGLGVLVGDFDNDGWPDIYVANDSTQSLMYKNLKNGKFVEVGLESGCVLSADGKPQAGMGVSAADYDLDGNLDILKTNFAGDTPSLYRNQGNWNFEDAHLPGRSWPTHAVPGLGMRLVRFRQRRLARHSHLQRTRLSRGRAAHDRGWISAEETALPQHPQRTLSRSHPIRRPRNHRPECLARLRLRRFRQRWRRRFRRQHRQRTASARSLRFETRPQLDQGKVHRHQVESQRHRSARQVRHPSSPTNRSLTSRSTRSAAAAATSRKATCAFTSASARPTRSMCSKFAGPAARWTR